MFSKSYRYYNNVNFDGENKLLFINGAMTIVTHAPPTAMESMFRMFLCFSERADGTSPAPETPYH